MKNEQNNLSLEEMLRLARKVDNWGESHYIFCGSLEELQFKISANPPLLLPMRYTLSVRYKTKIVSEYKISELKKDGRKIRELYKSLEIRIEENAKKRKQEALGYARSLL